MATSDLIACPLMRASDAARNGSVQRSEPSTFRDLEAVTDAIATATIAWSDVRAELRSRGLRWTPQRRLILDVLAATSGHVTGSEIVDRCREKDPETTPSTVYRTLDVLEELGYLHHSHGADGREEFHVLPKSEHAHLQCESCGRSWEIDPAEAHDLVRGLERTRRFTVHVGHLTIAGRCQDCAERAKVATAVKS